MLSVETKGIYLKFPKSKPEFLNGLELDGYNRTKQLAFEYQGRHHYMPIYGKKSLFLCKRNDFRKKLVCKNKGIRLIEIPYWIKPRDLRSYIVNKVTP